jgi:ribonuclease P protein component
MKTNTLNRHERLKSRKAIEGLMADAHTFHFFPVRVLYRISPAIRPEPLEVCTSVSKRKFKHAVDRNLLKRQMREAWRTKKQELRQALSDAGFQMDVMLIYTSKEFEEFAKINKKILLALERLVAEVKSDSNKSGNVQ